MLVLASEEAAQRYGLQPIARIVAQATHAQDPVQFTTAPIGCIKRLLQKTKLDVKDIDLFEINEAFSVVAMAAMKDLSQLILRISVNCNFRAVQAARKVIAA